MLGVIIGTGPWKEIAEQTAARAEALTGVPFVTIAAPFREVAHPSWLKLWVHDFFEQEDSFILLDADTIPLKRWDPRGWLSRDPGALWAARDRDIPCVHAECRDHGLRPDHYINAGLLLFHRKGGARILEAARQYHPEKGRWLEQTGINIAVRDGTATGRSRLRFLPRAINYVCKADDVLRDPSAHRHNITLHTVALGGDLEKFKAANEALIPSSPSLP
jgi:lipopolysaccharide biosynthesis glycosyltransferase